MRKALKVFVNSKIKINNSHKGMTLIEVLVSIALLGLLAVAFLPMFTTGFKFMIYNGNSIKTMYTNQDLIEQKIAQGTAADSSTMTIVFPSKTIDIKGEDITEGSFKLFITKK